MNYESNMRNQLKVVLLDFFLDATHYFDGKGSNEISLRDLNNFISEWMEKNFK